MFGVASFGAYREPDDNFIFDCLRSWLSICFALAGCSSFDELESDPKPPPAISKAAPNIKTVAAQYHLTGTLEIAGPIDAELKAPHLAASFIFSQASF
jgi:hypothetical protein